jgi:hypothetical protein
MPIGYYISIQQLKIVRTPQSLASIYSSTKPLLVADPAARPLN